VNRIIASTPLTEVNRAGMVIMPRYRNFDGKFLSTTGISIQVYIDHTIGLHFIRL